MGVPLNEKVSMERMRTAAACTFFMGLLFSFGAGAGTLTGTLANGLIISATEQKFLPEEHRLSGCGRAFASCVIDGAPAIGPIRMPKTRLADITLHVGERTLHLDTTGIFDPFLRPVTENFGAFCYDINNCTVRAILGDAGGTYVAEWIIANGVQRRSVLSDSSDLIEFMKGNLNPPHFQ